MRPFRCFGILLAVVLTLVAKPAAASAGGIVLTRYGYGGVTAFGAGAFATHAAYGVTPFGVAPFGAVQTFGVTPFAASPFGAVQTFGVSPFGGVQTYGVAPFGAAPFGAVQTFGAAPFGVGAFGSSAYLTSGGKKGRKNVVAIPTVLIPGANPPGASGSDVANDIKQIRDQLKALENDVEAIKRRLPPVKIVEETGLVTKEALDKILQKHAAYVKDLAEYHKKQTVLEIKMKAAADNIRAAKTDQEREKATAELIALSKENQDLRQPPPPTKDQ